MKKLLLTTAIVLVVGSSLAACFRDPNENGVVTGESFIRNIAAGDENAASSLLSSNASTAVTSYCSGKVLTCFDNMGRQKWGQLTVLAFDFGVPSPGAMALGYSVGWQNEAHFAVILVIKENGQWKVDGWRGFLEAFQDPLRSDLLQGKVSINQFPPTTATSTP